MAKRNLPGLGLTAGWPEGTNHWGSEMDSNLLELSVLSQAYVLGRVASEPGSPTQGDIWLLTGTTNADKLAVYDQGAWTYLAPTTGALIYVANEGLYYSYASGAWAQLVTSNNSTDYQDSVRIAINSQFDWATGGLITTQGLTLNDGNRVILIGQDFGAENIIYNAHSGAWTPATGWSAHSTISSGTIVPVDEGTFGGNLYQLLTSNPIDISVTPLTWQSNSRVGRTNFSNVSKSGDYTLTNVDNRKIFYLNGNGAQTLTLPKYSDVNLPSTSEILVMSFGSGTKTIQAVAGVTLNGVDGGSITIDTLYNVVWIKKRNRDEWIYDKKSVQPWYAELGAVLGTGASAVTAGMYVEYPIPFDCVIKSATALATPSGSATVDIYVCSYANYDGGVTHPVAADKITASAPIAVASSTKYTDSTLTGWTTTLNKGDIIRFIITGSPVAIQQITAGLTVERS